nr:hypothetical protein [Kiritimatiellia bacterium]
MDSVTTSTANRIYVKYSYDFQGRVIATHTPAPHTTPVADGLDFGNYSYTSNFYDSATGRLAYTDRSTSVASGVERRTYTYNSLGQVIATTPQSLYSNETQTGLV